MTYRAYFQSVKSLSQAQRQKMASLYFAYYTGSDSKQFLSDLAHKQEVLFLMYGEEIVGFSTLQFYPFRGHRIVYSGDTIVHPSHWKQQTLHGAWLRRIALLREEYPDERVFWFLLVKGVRTYRYMSTLALTFYPHRDGNIKEPELAKLAADLAKDKFGVLYNPARGVVECPTAFGYLNRTMAAVSDAQRSKPDVAFFLHKNPHYVCGHELVCLCEITPDNIHPRFQSLFTLPDVEFCHG
ncbi:hypothetical protein [Morganella psychrotolerans]|uniref:GNAT family N-acetyltransferase n=1 Tax=Morganella psychrotolerans TaxID=368603 RepID=A0A1B8H041_9GAMM|nr:hypothetical protein [Morganella psychrotolerans]OBU02421.1 hypothetical protein AYY17_12245 [Morganella psychrotolerans]